MLFPILGQAVYLLWWPSLTKDMQTEQLLCWNGMSDTEHSATSGSNEEYKVKSSFYSTMIADLGSAVIVIANLDKVLYNEKPLIGGFDKEVYWNGIKELTGYFGNKYLLKGGFKPRSHRVVY